MGGGSYDVHVGCSTRTRDPGAFDSGWDPDLGSRHGSGAVHDELDPKGVTRECCQETPIVVALDVTGSHFEEANLIFNRLPEFFGILQARGYVPEPAVSFAAVGDATCDSVPLQVGQFETDNRLDEVLSKIRLEGGGGGGMKETYELAAYYYATKSVLTGLPPGKKGYFFFLGDEAFYPVVARRYIRDILGDTQAEDVPAEEAFRLLHEKYHVYFIFPADKVDGGYGRCLDPWKKVLEPEHVLLNSDPNAIIDVIMGVLAIEEGDADLDDVAVDLGDLGRNTLEAGDTLKALKGLEGKKALVKVNPRGNLPKKGSGKPRGGRTQRL